MRALILALLAFPVLGHAQCGPVADADVIGRASGALPFAQQSGFSAQVYGKHLRANAIPEDGIQGPALANGDTLRFGKAGNALLFRLDPRDPVTSRSKRSEISFEPNIEPNKVYWIAFSVYLEDWGRLHPQDAALFGTQLHSGDNSLNLSPAFSLYTTAEGRRFKVQARWSTSATPDRHSTTTANYAERALPFGRWIDFLFRFKVNTANAGFLQVWMDGERIVDHRGNLGFNTPAHRDYVKFGYYNWSPVMSSPRKVLLRSPTIVLDPSGNQYGAAQLAKLLACQVHTD